MSTQRATVAEASQPTSAELLAALERERREILDFYRGLAPDDWQQPSLCAGWSVRDILAHLDTNDNPLWTTIISGFNSDRANQRLIDGLRGWTNAELLDEWARRVVPRGLVTWAPDQYLADDWVHHNDARWALGRARPHDPEQLRLALYCNARLHKRRIAGLRLVADDIGWEHGLADGPLVQGPAEALAMGIANRPAARAQLSGGGVAQLFR